VTADIPPTAAIVIPARYGSSRFPGKPLARETGKFLIEHVVEEARQAKRAAQVIVATDDQRIADAVASFGGRAVMTSSEHPSGTDRIAEVMRRPEFSKVGVVVNVQGDEPEIEAGLIDQLIEVTGREGVSMATVSAPFERESEVANPNVVKVVTDEGHFALYFSRSVIPYDRDGDVAPRHAGLYRKHLGIYAYKREALLRLAGSPMCELERTEKLEQLRALYLGMKIFVVETQRAPHGIDTPEDYSAFVKRYNDGSSQEPVARSQK
jgi:3-deoxy-manno-octulosonate cytidylyltransferase (CMP-KDO synthetase)